MELRDLRTFLAVARRLSFHRAGEEVHAAQSTVSARIAALERDLGLRLFERLGRRVVLTPAGERLREYAAKMADLEDEARAWVVAEDAARGALAVRVPESLCACRLGPAIRAFRERFPGVRLSFTTCALDGLEKDLRQGVTDLALVYADGLSGADLAVECLGVEPLALYAAPGHPLAGRPALGLEHLAGQTLALSSSDCAYRRGFEALLEEGGVALAPSLEFSSTAALLGCVGAGLGLALLPEVAAAGDLAAGRLVRLDWSAGPLETGVLLARHRGKWPAPPLAAFVEILRQALAR